MKTGETMSPALCLMWAWFALLLAPLYGVGSTDFPPTRGTGGKLLNAALDNVLGPRKSSIPSSTSVDGSLVRSHPHIGGLPVTKIRMRCDRYLACGNMTPTIEISNPIINRKIVYFNHPDQQSLEVISKFPEYFADVPGRLPSCMGKVPENEAWLPGPRFAIINATSRPRDVPTSCGEYLDTSAHFLFAWEHTNVFHSLNDNLFKVLTSLIIQRYTQTGPDEILTDAATLYVFDVSPFSEIW
jgi:hypothetical protein